MPIADNMYAHTSFEALPEACTTYLVPLISVAALCAKLVVVLVVWLRLYSSNVVICFFDLVSFESYTAVVLKALRTEPQGSARETSGLRELFVWFFFCFIVVLRKSWSISSWAP